MLHTLCTMGPLCHAWLFFPSSLLLHEAVVSSSADDQLLILLSAWGAGTSPIPPSWADPISLRLQIPLLFSVGYKLYWQQVAPCHVTTNRHPFQMFQAIANPQVNICIRWCQRVLATSEQFVIRVCKEEIATFWKIPQVYPVPVGSECLEEQLTEYYVIVSLPRGWVQGIKRMCPVILMHGLFLT
jgi:hypothetical protein